MIRRPRYRCPECQVIHYTPDAECRGGWPVYDPARPGAWLPRHPARLVVLDTQTGCTPGVQ